MQSYVGIVLIILRLRTWPCVLGWLNLLLKLRYSETFYKVKQTSTICSRITTVLEFVLNLIKDIISLGFV